MGSHEIPRRKHGACVTAVLRLVGCEAVAALCCVLVVSGPAAADPLPDRVAPTAWTVVENLALVGPRVPGTERHEEAVAILLRAMRAAGLEEVRALPARAGATGTPVQITGLLRGSEPGEILINAHYDTVGGSPGAADDASGCGVALAAIVDLRRTPLRRSVRVVLFDDEERDRAGSRSWVEGMTAEARNATLAALTLEMLGIGAPGDRGVVVTLPAAEETGLPLAPGWLVHAALEGSRAVGLELAMVDTRHSLMAQLGLRSGRPSIASDTESLLEGGIPALLLTDLSLTRSDPMQHQPTDRPERLSPERLEAWTGAVASIVRRLDALDGRPRSDSEYLVVADRVRPRRDLLWVCFGVWVLSVWRGLPGAWRGRAAIERRRRGRFYLPGYVFRGLFLVAALLAPVFAVTLLAPAALVGLAAHLFPRRETAICLIGLLPAALYLAGLLAGLAGGWITPDASALPAQALVGATLAAFCIQVRFQARG